MAKLYTRKVLSEININTVNNTPSQPFTVRQARPRASPRDQFQDTFHERAHQINERAERNLQINSQSLPVVTRPSFLPSQINSPLPAPVDRDPRQHPSGNAEKGRFEHFTKTQKSGEFARAEENLQELWLAVLGPAKKLLPPDLLAPRKFEVPQPEKKVMTECGDESKLDQVIKENITGSEENRLFWKLWVHIAKPVIPRIRITGVEDPIIEDVPLVKLADIKEVPATDIFGTLTSNWEESECGDWVKIERPVLECDESDENFKV